MVVELMELERIRFDFISFALFEYLVLASMFFLT